MKISNKLFTLFAMLYINSLSATEPIKETKLYQDIYELHQQIAKDRIDVSYDFNFSERIQNDRIGFIGEIVGSYVIDNDSIKMEYARSIVDEKSMGNTTTSKEIYVMAGNRLYSTTFDTGVIQSYCISDSGIENLEIKEMLKSKVKPYHQIGLLTMNPFLPQVDISDVNSFQFVREESGFLVFEHKSKFVNQLKLMNTYPYLLSEIRVYPEENPEISASNVVITYINNKNQSLLPKNCIVENYSSSRLNYPFRSVKLEIEYSRRETFDFTELAVIDYLNLYGASKHLLETKCEGEVIQKYPYNNQWRSHDDIVKEKDQNMQKQNKPELPKMSNNSRNLFIIGTSIVALSVLLFLIKKGGIEKS